MGTRNEKHLYEETQKKLDHYYRKIKHHLIPFQSSSTGLFSCNSEAYVRDSVYCSAAIWALALAYRRVDNDNGRTYELEHAAVKGMRGILYCYMRQASRVESFKTNQKINTALHCKFDHWSGDAGDEGYHHLQLDVVATFVLYLVQMTASGLQIIFNTDEVAFVQNLVYYLERSYRVPDYGMWERGSKYNNGSSELHASSIGAAKAALESANGFNLFGTKKGAPWSVLWVDIDAHNRNRTVMDSLLPRESNSKSTDMALLPMISFPFFALDKEDLRDQTMQRMLSELEGKNGFKRFSGDGYNTAMEDKSRSYYLPSEIKQFNGIECEWPLFYVYLLIDAIIYGKSKKVKEYKEKLKPLLVHHRNMLVLPRFYYVSREKIDEERSSPGSVARFDSFSLPDEPPVFLWGEALYTIYRLLDESLVTPRDLDPIKRYLPLVERHKVSMRYSTFDGVTSDTVIQVALIAESKHLQTTLSTYGFATETPEQVEPIEIWPSQELVKVYRHLGSNEKLGLTGRPNRPIGILGTSKLYSIHGRTVICYPLMFDVGDFYMAYDTQTLLHDLRNSLEFIASYWRMPMRPLFLFLLREDDIQENRKATMLQVLSAFKQGIWEGMQIRLGRIHSFVASSVIEHLEFARQEHLSNMEYEMIMPFHGKESEMVFGEICRLRRSGSSYTNLSQLTGDIDEETQQARKLKSQSTEEILSHLQDFRVGAAKALLLGELSKREGLSFETGRGTCYDRLNSICRRAAQHESWSLVRYTASLCHKVVDSLAPSITSVLVHDKHITLGVFGHEEAVISNPLPPSTIKDILYSLCGPHDEREACLQQELVLHVGNAINKKPQLFEGMLQIRIGWLSHAMRLMLEHKRKLNLDGEIANDIHDLSPSQVKHLMYDALNVENHKTMTWLEQKQIAGALNKTPCDFYTKVWLILERSPDGFIINQHHLPQQPTLSDMGNKEVGWWKKVGEMFAGMYRPELRHLVIEALMATAVLLERNPEVSFKTRTNIDEVVRSAIAAYKNDPHYNENKENEETDLDDISLFCNLPPESSVRFLMESIIKCLLQGQIDVTTNSHCRIS